MGKFVITKRRNGEYQFSLKANNGAVILASEGYTSKIGCLNGVESVKRNSQLDSHFDKKESSSGKFYFNLKASNGQIIGSSEMYESPGGRDNGIEAVKTSASTANIDDNT